MPIHAKSLFAETYVVSSSVTSMSIAYNSGSTLFGDSYDDTHIFSGSIVLDSNSHITASGDISGSSTSTGSFAMGNFADKVGIGTTSPTTPLHVKSAATDTAGILLEAASGGEMLFRAYESSAGHGQIYMQPNGGGSTVKIDTNG